MTFVTFIHLHYINLFM